jgi:hypothetical protein
MDKKKTIQKLHAFRSPDRSLLRSVFSGSLLALALCATAYGGEPPVGSAERPYEVPRAIAPVIMDGTPDEAVWDSALQMELPYETRPGENVPAAERTVVLVTYDDESVYFAFRAWDPKPGAIRAHLSEHDEISLDDQLGVELDTFNDERRAYSMFINPLGVKEDCIISSDLSFDCAWDAIWHARTQIHYWGYTAEIAIPFSSIRLQRDGSRQTWGFTAYRYYPRDKDYFFSVAPRDRSNKCRQCQMLKIRGFEGASPGHNLELLPTVTAVGTQAASSVAKNTLTTRTDATDLGLTAHWGVTPGLTLSATVNPDFSQVEADVVQLDINEPFALFYPERRPFFTEGGDFFRTMFNAVHTRMLREPAWGVKVSGKQAAHTIGAYVVRDEITNIVFPGSQGSSGTSLAEENTSAAVRYRRDLGTRFAFGALYTGRSGGEYSSHLFGLDASLRFTDTDWVVAQVLGSHTRYPESMAIAFGQPEGALTDLAINLRYDHDTRSGDWYLEYEELGDDFRADLGFIPRVGYRASSGGVSYSWIAPPKQWWTQYKVGTDVEYVQDATGGVLGRQVSVWSRLDAAYHTTLIVTGRRSFERFQGVGFDADTVDFTCRVRPMRRLQFDIKATMGDRIDYSATRLGERVRLVPGVTGYLGRHFEFAFEHAFERMNVEGGRLYTADISQGTLRYKLNLRTLIRTILQYEHYDYNLDLYSAATEPDVRRLLGQLLFSYEVNPRTVLHLGLGENAAGARERGLNVDSRTVFVKLAYAWMP